MGGRGACALRAPEILEGNSASEVMTQTIIVLGGLLCAVGASDVGDHQHGVCGLLLHVCNPAPRTIQTVSAHVQIMFACIKQSNHWELPVSHSPIPQRKLLPMSGLCTPGFLCLFCLKPFQTSPAGHGLGVVLSHRVGLHGK